MRKAGVVLLLLVVLSVGLLGITAGSAEAGGPIVYRQAGNHYTPMFGVPSAGRGDVVQQWLNPGERFNMKCWVDNNHPESNSQGWYNYYSVRWFFGESFRHGWGWVHSSYVYYQWRVPRCR